MNVEIVKKPFPYIKIDDLFHLWFNCEVLAVHSYIDEKPNPRPNIDDPSTLFYKMYYINFYLDSGQMVHCEYNNRDLWEQILKGLE